MDPTYTGKGMTGMLEAYTKEVYVKLYLYLFALDSGAFGLQARKDVI
jgi:1-aminocyclopropane-1-carboxylate deaminase/D-cysteine desulfhydrase-like pyridoxal-dependent ACC family enzyme